MASSKGSSEMEIEEDTKAAAAIAVSKEEEAVSEAAAAKAAEAESETEGEIAADKENEEEIIKEFEIMRADGSWICKECGLHNSAGNHRCAACFAYPSIRKYELPKIGRAVSLAAGKLSLDSAAAVADELEDDTVLIKLAYAVINNDDIERMKSGGDSYTPGQLATGVVVKVGGLSEESRAKKKKGGVRPPRVGQRVLVFDSEFGTGQGSSLSGGCRDFVVCRSNQVRYLPNDLSLADGCFLPALYAASEAVNRMFGQSRFRLRKPDSVLVLGCGSLGLFAIALIAAQCKSSSKGGSRDGGPKIIASDLNPDRRAKALAFGADAFIAATSMKAFRAGVDDCLAPPPAPPSMESKSEMAEEEKPTVVAAAATATASVDSEAKDEEEKAEALPPSPPQPRLLTRILDTTGMTKLISEAVSLIGERGRIVLAAPQSSGQITMDLAELYSKRLSLVASRTDDSRLPRKLRALSEVNKSLASVVEKQVKLESFTEAFTAAAKTKDEVLIGINEL